MIGLGVTIHYTLTAKTQSDVDAIIRKWEERYKPELDLAKIKHRYKRLDETGSFSVNSMEVHLRHLGISTYEELLKLVDEGKLVILDKVPSVHEFARIVEARRLYVALRTPFGRDWRTFLREYPKLPEWRVIWVYPSVHPFIPRWGREGVEYILAPGKGFVDTPSTTESFAVYFVKLPERYCADDFIKTQPFTDEEAAPNTFIHMLICDFLRDVEKEGLADVYIRDEGDYCKTGDRELLMKSFGATAALIGRIASTLEKMGWKKL